MANQEQTQNIQPRMRKQGLMPMHRPLGRWLIQISSRLFYFLCYLKIACYLNYHLIGCSLGNACYKFIFIIYFCNHNFVEAFFLFKNCYFIILFIILIYLHFFPLPFPFFISVSFLLTVLDLYFCFCPFPLNFDSKILGSDP
jgi:hypothetical protein